MTRKKSVREFQVFNYLNTERDLHNYFNNHVCSSLRCQPVCPFILSLFQFLQSYHLMCGKSEKYVILVTLRPLRSMKRGKAELSTYIMYIIRLDKAELNLSKLFSVLVPGVYLLEHTYIRSTCEACTS